MATVLQKKQAARRLSARREYREVNRLRIGLEKTFTFRLIRLFSEIGNQAASAVESSGSVALSAIFPDIRSNLERLINQLYEQTIKTFSDRAIANRRNSKAIASFEDLYTSFIRTQGAERVQGITVTTQRIVQRVIEENQTAGNAVIGRAIRERFEPRFSRSRAATIARTEVHNAASYATHEQQRSFGVPEMRKQWVANIDDRTRASHAAVSGTQLDMDEDFIVAGKKMAYPSDPRGGAAEVINCRCVLIYVEPEETIEDLPPVAQAANPRRKPLRPSVDEIPILAKAAATRAITGRFRASQDALVENQPEIATISIFKGRNKNLYGKANTGSLDKETASLLNQTLKETDEIGSTLRINPLRGLVPIRQPRKKSNAVAWANMGDGVMGYNAAYFNNLATKAVKGRVGDIDPEVIKSRIKELDDEITELKRFGDKKFGNLEDASSKFWSFKLRGADDRRSFSTLEADEYDVWRKQVNALESSKFRETERLKKVSVVPASKWKFGDDLLERPHNSHDYFENPLDQMRSTVYHEYGHHVHQTYLVNTVGEYRNPLVEKWMKSVAKPNSRKVATIYGDKNEKEWFAENFSLYYMAREDLVDPLFVRLIEAIQDGKPLPND